MDFKKYWHNKITSEMLSIKDVSEILAEFHEAVHAIAPWLSASLDSRPCGEYEDACNTIFVVDIKYELPRE
jgi:hypothetical protein